MLKTSSMIRSIFVLVAVVFALGHVAHAADEAVRVATVDMQKALQTVEAGKKAKASLEASFNAKKKEFQAEEAAIKKMGDDFKKQAAVLSDKARMEKQMEISDRIARFQDATARSQAEIQMKEREMTAPIINKLRDLIADTAKKKGYSVVLEKNENTVLFSLEKDDLTAEVVTAFNKHSG